MTRNRIGSALLSLLIVLAGCSSDMQPDNVITRFISAVGSSDNSLLSELLSRDSQVMLKTNLARGNGVRVFIDEAAQSRLDVDYELVIHTQNDNRAVVLLKDGPKGLKVFDDPSLPSAVARAGLPLYLVKENGQWKVDLATTEAKLLEKGLEAYRDKLPSTAPQWMPSPMGMPSPPGYTEKQQKAK